MRSVWYTPKYFFVLFIFLAIACMLLGFLLTSFPWENMVLVQLHDGTSFSQEEISQLTEDSVFSQIYPYSREGISLATTGSKSVNSVLYGVTTCFFKSFPFVMKDGRVLWEEDIGQQYTMISDDAAGKLFGRDNVVGEIVYLNNESFIVIGVYKSQQDFITNLAYHGEDIVYVIQDSSTSLKATHLIAVLRNPRDASLGLKWLERFNIVNENLIGIHNLAQSWSFLKLISRGYMSIYGLIFGWAVLKKARPLYVSQQELIKEIWDGHYAISALRISCRPLLIISGLIILLLLWVIGLVAFILAGIVIPTEYIPQKLLWEPIRNALRLYVITTNTSVAIVHPLVALSHWWHVLLLTVGTIGGGLALYLRQKWVIHP